MELLLEFISKYANAGIIIFAIIVLGGLLWNAFSLSNHKARFKEELNSPVNRKVDVAAKTVEEKEDEKAIVKPDKIRELEMKFNKTCSVHAVLAQCIPVFPLLGILGTVAGLMMELQAGDINAMMESLDVALGTTFWGLVAAIFLKLLDAASSARIIFDIEAMLDDFDKKIRNMEFFQKFEEEK